MSQLVYSSISFLGKRTVVVMAASAEYGEHLQTIIQPYWIGVGILQAAMNITKLLERAKYRNDLPELILNIGSAGSNKFERGDIYQISSASYRDMDASPFGFEKGKIPFSDKESVLQLHTPLNNIKKATISSGSNVIDVNGTTGKSYKDIKEDMVDMETYALAWVASDYNIPVIGLRGVSDGKSQVKGISCWEDYLHIIDSKLYDIIKKGM
jgi:adenosylhomocysteine nucleosidase